MAGDCWGPGGLMHFSLVGFFCFVGFFGFVAFLFFVFSSCFCFVPFLLFVLPCAFVCICICTSTHLQFMEKIEKQNYYVFRFLKNIKIQNLHLLFAIELL